MVIASGGTAREKDEPLEVGVRLTPEDGQDEHPAGGLEQVPTTGRRVTGFIGPDTWMVGVYET